jgi:hypothetical protein
MLFQGFFDLNLNLLLFFDDVGLINDYYFLSLLSSCLVKALYDNSDHNKIIVDLVSLMILLFENNHTKH